MADAYLLSEEDRNKLRKLMGEHGASGIVHQPQEKIQSAPDVYIAKVKTDPGSIPALTPKGDDDYDHPGMAMCDIYQVTYNSSLSKYDLVPISGLRFPVFNLTKGDIGDDWLLVIKDKSGRWVASAGGAVATSWFQLLTDNDLESYLAYGNPGVFSTETGFLYDEHWDDTPPNNPEWTVLLVDGTGNTPCWRGDWVQAVPIDYTLPAPYDEYQIMMITHRASSQLKFYGQLGQYDLLHNSSATASLIINGVVKTKTVYDMLLLPGQYLPKYTEIVATYFPDLRKFYVNNAPCDTAACT